MTDFKPSERDDGLIDWITDFDILDESYVEEPAAVWRSLRAACPVAHTDRYGSTWLPVDYDDLASIAHDVERFSSRGRSDVADKVLSAMRAGFGGHVERPETTR